MSPRSERLVGFGGSAIRIEHEGAAAANLVAFLFRDATEAVADLVRTTFHVEAAADGTITVRAADVVYYRGAHVGEAALALQEATSYALAAAAAGGLLFHAGAVDLGDRAVLFPGKTGAGKTTLTAHAVSRGARYLSDEFAFVSEGGAAVRGLPRPFNVKAAGRAAVDLAADWTTLDGSAATLVLPPRSTAACPVPPPPLGAIVFPRFRDGAVAQLTPLRPGECGMRLMGALLNARNVEGHGFAAVSDLARRTPAFELVYGDVREAGAMVLDLVAAARA